MKLIKDMIDNPGLYRKLWMSLTAAAFAIANGVLGMTLDETVYTKGMEEIFNLVILLGGSVAVYKARNG